jgi:hypothetical protein
VDENGMVILPPGVRRPMPPSPAEAQRGMVVNETDLPDHVVVDAVGTYFEEHASVLGVNHGNASFQAYANDTGSLLARSKYRTPSTVFEEIALARDMAERDDDVGAAMGMMLAVAFADGMQHQHRDEVVLELFNEVARHADMDGIFNELYREWLISGQVNTATVFTQEQFSFQPQGADRARSRTIIAPLIGILPAELIRVIDNDMFRTGTLAYRPANGHQERWLREFFAPDTSPGRKAEMRQQDPVLTTLLIDKIEQKASDYSLFFDDSDDPCTGNDLYLLNPRYVRRSTMPKGAWKYPRPPLTRDFALLEAKRLLNLMDYALLQGGSNFLVVAKKGSDQRPALPEEVTNLHEMLKRATRTGVLIGDHRLNIEIITPNLKELLSPEKRKLLGRKLANALLRLPDIGPEDPGTEGAKDALLLAAQVITNDRRALRRHVENNIYDEVRKRNESLDGAAGIWFPKIILQGAQFFTDMVLSLRDRGDISRRSAVQVAGFDYDAEVQARRREKPDDQVMTPAAVPFSSPNAGPQDNGGGRPRGSGPDNGAPGATQRPRPAQQRPTQRIAQNAGETVRAMYEEEVGSFRCGELTYAVLSEFPDRTIGRLTPFEQRAMRFLDSGEWPGPMEEGPVTIVPVNEEYAMHGVRAVRLAPGLSMLLGYRDGDDAMVARAFCFRQPEYAVLDAEERALGWGFPTRPLLESGD